MGAGAVMRRAKGRKALCCRVAHVPIATCGVCESCEKRLMHPLTAVMLRDMKTRRIDSARAPPGGRRIPSLARLVPTAVCL